MKYYVCSDPHSYFSIMRDALHDAGWRKYHTDEKIILVGDAFDRGGEPVEMYHFLRDLGDNLIFCRGNHEDLLFDAARELKEWGRVSSRHHWHNGTDKTVYAFNYENILDEVLDWINEKTIDYYETDHYIFTHGWIPCQVVDKFGQVLGNEYNANWREADQAKWYNAKWQNGMQKWHMGIKEPGKTIVCGHWHCGWANLLYHEDQSSEGADAEYYLSDHPFIDDGIIAIDTCTALTKKVNVIIIED